MDRSQEAIARLIREFEGGDRDSVDELFALVYDELKGLAHRQRRRWSGNHTLNTTALVHEVYVKLVGQERLGTDGRAHFRALAARAMRHVLCNYARDQVSLRRGGGRQSVSADAIGLDIDPYRATVDAGSADRLCELDAALEELERSRPRASRVVECRFFGAMTVDETAAAMGISPRSVKRDWAIAQAWLHRALEGDVPSSDSDAPGSDG